MPTHIDMRCLTCGYPLRGLKTPTCPECGRAFDSNDPRSFGVFPPASKAWTTGKNFAIGFLVMALLLDGAAWYGVWSIAYPLALLGGLGALLLSVASALLSLIYLARNRAKSFVAWFVLLGALGAGGAGVEMMRWATEIINAI